MNNKVSDLLFIDRPLVVNPLLAVEIGLNEAVVLQQIKYWVERTQHRAFGRGWVYKTVNDWGKEFPFWSNGTIRRTIKSLSDSGLIETRKLHGHFYNESSNQTLWYSLSPVKTPCDQNELMGKKEEIPCDQNEQMDVINLSKCTCDQIDQLSTETTTEITPETTSPKSPKGEKVDLNSKLIISYLNESKEKLASELGQSKPRGARSIKSNLRKISSRLKDGYTIDDCKLVIDYLHQRWGHEQSMNEYFVLGSVFVASKFEDKLIKAQAWADAGRPEYRHGAFTSNSYQNSSVDSKRNQDALEGLLRSARTLEDV
ncbi:conserved hypothetical protein [Vibrio crassostreae]|uniref:conserved phage C-terminal domain-containing protein n=1 Tax=Vibrio crassostreae TaxID=246167 RepID=UPI001B30B554|nr:conserved phage C-terminal domain-containing protein [Vibrio crassostreae]CAK1923495.1 conserved hypothetical protein [Vibrio crassostreae]CAK2309021.1 conserved hypothetical protein [Vibrio crassostreae]CAK2326711.1 conserved hypothetical protein [Vibrio crassostreae]CAK3241717.1 conserved hypothetical protein [Vibrio crassostreae]